ncbi:MAG: carboxy terminal-processing peptidase [Luteolibacter sp.]
MKAPRVCRQVLLTAALATTSLPALAAPIDLGEIGKQEVIALRNAHLSLLPYGAETSQRMLAQYLDQLDPGHSYFLQSDIDAFRKDYGNDLFTLMLKREALKPALAIHRIYQQRVAVSVGLAKQLLAENRFDFHTPESIQPNRRSAAWPRDEKEAAELLRLRVKDALLDEMLRAENLTKNQTVKNPADRRTPAEIVNLRYGRFSEKIAKADDEQIASGFFNAMVRAYDPHSDYMNALKTDGFGNSMRNEMVGIGVSLESLDDGSTRISGIFLGSPADRSGVIQPGDRIVGVDSAGGVAGPLTDVLQMTTSEVAALLVGGEGTKVRIRILPADDSGAREVMIPRERVRLKADEANGGIVDLRLPERAAHRLGWIELPGFYVDFKNGRTSSSADVQKLLARLMDGKIDGLLLDLRGNGGGSVEEARRIAGFFMGNGPVLQEKDRLGRIETLPSGQRAIYRGPMAVLVDRQSASASEILAGALQDYRRAVIVGDHTTFGKGTVQEPIDLAQMMPYLSNRDGVGTLKLTSKRFYLPSGASTQINGVTSDIAMPGRYDAAEVGERHLPHALAEDRIRPSSGFAPLPDENLFLTTLRELSKQRVETGREFAYINEDIALASARLKQNARPLDVDERRKIQTDDLLRKQERNAERAPRFKALAEDDKRNLAFYRLTLDDLSSGRGLHLWDPSTQAEEFARTANTPTSALSWPSGLEPAKREALLVLNDLVSCVESPPLVENRKVPTEIH